jgi:hypothetical protein
MRKNYRILVSALTLTSNLLLSAGPALAQSATPSPRTPPAVQSSSADDHSSFLLTIFLRHDESKTLSEINQHLKQTGYYKRFPPPGVEVVSWYVMMGIGQVVTLRVPADKLRDVNRVLEETAWGGYRTEYYPTYDYRALAEQARKEIQ